MKQSIENVKIGNCYSDITENVSEPGCRLAEQHRAVMEYHSNHPSAFWLINPFSPEPDGRIFTCSFFHHYYDVDGRMCSIKVTKTGRIKEIYASKIIDTEAAKECMEVIEKYGAFQGE